MQKLTFSLRLFLIAVCFVLAGQNIYLAKAANGQTISDAEYFIDTDPGEGSGIALQAEDGAFDSGTEVAVINDVDTSALSVGSHVINVRFKDSNGKWGDVKQETLNVNAKAVSNEITIIAAEYYFDTDPGEGNGTQMTAEDGAFDSDTEELSINNVDTSDLSIGEHTVFVRAKDSTDKWSTQSSSATFEVLEGSGPTATPTPEPTPTMSPEPTTSPEPTASLTPEPTPIIPGETFAPTAEFEANVITGFEPLTVIFTDKSLGNPSNWAWEFGDGGISIEQNPTHTYEKEGNYSAKLTVSNSKGSDVEEKLNFIAVENVEFCVAAFNVDKTSGFAPLEVSFSDKSTGSPASWAWEFGDGGTSSEQNPTHTYQVPGIYTVKLTTGASCGSDTLTQTNLIFVRENAKPTAEFSANPNVGFAPLDVQFSNLTAGDTTSFAWSFGDGGSSAEENPLYTYRNPGIYTVTLTASNGSGTDIITKTNLIHVSSKVPPTAAFEASPLTGFAPLNVPFTDTSTGNVANWNWEFGDGATSILQNPVHEYKNPGFYNVKLTVSGQNGADSENKTNLINVLDGQGPTAAFAAEPLTGNAPFTVHFFDLSSGEIANRTWEFGDGEISVEQNPVHTFNSAGSFNVKLTVSGKDGTSTENKIGLITVLSGTDPSAGFTVDKQTRSSSDLSGELKVRFSDVSSSTSGAIVNRLWDFGDGNFSSEEDPEHTYTGSNDDVFSVSLTVRDSKGANTVTKPAFISLEKPDDDTDVLPTPGGSAEFKVEPSAAGKSLRNKNAIVSIKDENGNPVSDVTVTATVSGDRKAPEVSPESTVTDENGEAGFKFRFPFRGRNGVITFNANGKTVTVTQE